jgi:Na+/proline symporter
MIFNFRFGEGLLKIIEMPLPSFLLNYIDLAEAMQLAVTMAMVGAIWVVQLCVYPRFMDIDPDRFVRAHLRHSFGIGLIVAPLMVTEFVAAIFLVWAGYGGFLQWVVLALTLGNLISTALIQAPCHTRLMKGYDEFNCRFLIRSNWQRTVLWSVKGILVFALVCG